MALQKWLELGIQALGDLETCGTLRIAVIEDDERVVPVGGDIDAIGGTADEANFGETGGSAEDGGPGCGLLGEDRRAMQAKYAGED